jgi:hypothetical protein
VKRQLSQKEQDRARKDRVLPDYTGDKFGRYPGAGQKLSGLGGSRGYNPMNPSSGFTRGYRYGAHDSSSFVSLKERRADLLPFVTQAGPALRESLGRRS